MPNALHSAASVLHYTPSNIAARTRSTFGGRIDLDAASDEFGNRVMMATRFYTATEDGLHQPWRGNVFCNPPGRSEDNIGGAAAWWHKAVREFNANDNTNIVFLGFSLELLQTCQSYSSQHPLSFTYCIPRSRIRFEVNLKEHLAQLEAKYVDEATVPSQLESIRRKIARARVLLSQGNERIAGGSPTHGNIIVCVTRKPSIQQNFRYYFSALGFVGGL